MLKRLLLSITLFLIMAVFVNADETAQNAAPEALNIAVADDFAPVAKEIGKEFTYLSGIPVNFTTGSSEELLQKIKKGEQFDVFMSGNTDYPVDLEKSGFTDGSPEIYAVGSLALYSKGKELTHNGLDVLQPGGFSKLGVADPKMSPYGVAAIETLKKLQIYEEVQGQIVYADNVEKVLKMAESGEVDAGLVAYGDLSDKLKSKAWIVPGRMHSHIEQSMVALKNGNAAAIKKWMMFIESDTTKNILISSGFGVTNVEKGEE
jgi:molybdate transport system substrate-binding protein